MFFLISLQMNCIVLDDDDDCVMVEPTSKPQEPNKGANFQKKLILQVRKHRMLYDNKHKMFSNVDKKELIWQRIAKKLNIEGIYGFHYLSLSLSYSIN